MTRLLTAIRVELTIATRQKFLHAGVFSGLIWLAVLLPMPRDLRPVAEPYVLALDVAIIGFFIVGGSVFFEKQEPTLGAIIATPLRFWEYPCRQMRCAGGHLVVRGDHLAIVPPVPREEQLTGQELSPLRHRSGGAPYRRWNARLNAESDV